MNNAVYEKKRKKENLRIRIDVKLVKKKKGYLKWTSKPNQAICHTKYLTLTYLRYIKTKLH